MDVFDSALDTVPTIGDCGNNKGPYVSYVIPFSPPKDEFRGRVASRYF